MGPGIRLSLFGVLSALKKQSCSGLRIEIDIATRMSSQCGSWAQGIDWSLESAANSISFRSAGDRAEDCLPREQCRHCHRQRMGRHFTERGETLVIDLLLPALSIEVNDLHRERIIKIRGRIVEREMAVDANSATNNVDWPFLQLHCVIGSGLHRIVSCRNQMHGSKRKMIEDRVPQPISETLRRVLR